MEKEDHFSELSLSSEERGAEEMQGLIEKTERKRAESSVMTSLERCQPARGVTRLNV